MNARWAGLSALAKSAFQTGLSAQLALNSSDQTDSRTARSNSVFWRKQIGAPHLYKACVALTARSKPVFRREQIAPHLCTAYVALTARSVPIAQGNSLARRRMFRFSPVHDIQRREALSLAQLGAYVSLW